MKNRNILFAIATIISANAAYAGNFDEPEIAPASISPVTTANDWAGLYAGGLVSFSSGDNDIYYNGIPYNPNDLTLSGTEFGAFAGYNIQRGAFVYGGEFAVSLGGLKFEGYPKSFLEVIYDLKARVGYSFGNAMAYGVVGGMWSIFNTTGQGERYPSSGFIYGAGLEYKLSEHMFVGAEYLFRDISGTAEVNDAFELQSNIQSAQLRIGWNF